MEQLKLRYKPVKAVIFELDGLLVDSLSMQRSIFTQIFLLYNKVLSRNILNEISGRSAEDAIQILMEYTKLETSKKDILYAYNFQCEKLLPNVQIMAGTFELIKYFYTVGICMGIVSSSLQDHFIYKTVQHYNFFKDMFKSVALYDSNNNNGKPATELYLKCAKDLCASRLDEILAFVSTKVGLEAALKCGMQVVMVPDKFMGDPDSTRSSTVCIRSLNSFVPEEFGLPSKCKCNGAK